MADLRKAVTVTATEPPPAVPEAPPPDPIEPLEQEYRELAAKIERTIPLVPERRWRLKIRVCGLRDQLNKLEVMI